jgi:hypothetical protein
MLLSFRAVTALAALVFITAPLVNGIPAPIAESTSNPTNDVSDPPADSTPDPPATNGTPLDIPVIPKISGGGISKGPPFTVGPCVRKCCPKNAWVSKNSILLTSSCMTNIGQIHQACVTVPFDAPLSLECNYTIIC